jgi:hypothetical protein
LWGLRSILTVAGAALAAVFMRHNGGGVLLILQILMWLQIFLIGMERGLKELYSHYIYLIPASSFSKIVWSNLETVGKGFVESLFLFGVAGVILGEFAPIVLGAILVYTLFSLLLIGVNYLSLRWTGGGVNMGMLLLLYAFAVVLILLPGIAAAILTAVFVVGGGPWAPAAGLGVLALWELIAALLCFTFAKGILHNCDMPAVKSAVG